MPFYGRCKHMQPLIGAHQALNFGTNGKFKVFALRKRKILGVIEGLLSAFQQFQPAFSLDGSVVQNREKGGAVQMGCTR